MNIIQWTEKAFRQLRKIKDSQASRRIYQEAQELVHFPECRNVKRLTNHQYSYRLRVGDWRVFFEFDGGVKIISIEEVKKRNEHTY
ncbi:type II toxin-antitoxin system RelE/ParE family toxin [Desulfobulbus sp.]|uniref:type II toxin-antitoxin system RelE family toxin n=1 Tax=Desulfobulbus sp. TaxID=895 RepID=UPI0027B9402E|nr:type II toxin-antitoxin system RelE/ParE family toxin [Desulfobulbus sp.]